MSTDARRKASLRAAATRELAWGLRIIETHSGPLVYRQRVPLGRGNTKIVSLHLPGVLRISDAQTGQVIAESRPGDLLTLADTFEPLDPA